MPRSFPAVAGSNQLSRHENASVQGEVITTDINDVAVIAQTNTKKQLVVRKIILNVYTSAAQAFQFQGDGAGGDPVYNVAASPGVGPRQIDFGELGYALPAGEGLEIALGGTGGNAFTFLVEAYMRPIAGAGTPAQMV